LLLVRAYLGSPFLCVLATFEQRTASFIPLLVAFPECMALIAARDSGRGDPAETRADATIAKQIASLDGIGVLVARNYLMQMSKSDLAALIDATSLLTQLTAAKLLEVLAAGTWAENISATLSAQVKTIDWMRLARSAAALDRTRTAQGEAEA
jgi:hypothetical protein